MSNEDTDVADPGSDSKLLGTDVRHADHLHKRTITVEIPLWCACCTAFILLGLLTGFCIVAILSSMHPRFWVSPEVLESMGVDGVIMFRQYDRDSDGVLSLDEFEPLAHRLMDINETYNYDHQINPMSNVVTVWSHFKPLLLSSLSKETIKKTGGLDPLRGLKMWKVPQQQWKKIEISDFEAFLPDNKLLYTKVGHVYRLAGLPEDMDRGVTLSSNRYYPPRLVDRSEIMIYRLLSMFHSRAFIISRFAPQGTFACIRAYNEQYIDVVFRIHAEFQLNEPPFYPFWFTPGQFTGRLIINKNKSDLLHFQLKVPTNKKLNVDMEFLTGPRGAGNMEVDIGFIDLLELALHDENNDVHILNDSIPWSREIDIEEAQRKIDTHFYPFKEITYHNFKEAFHLAKDEKKFVHSIILWGALDDQSC